MQVGKNGNHSAQIINNQELSTVLSAVAMDSTQETWGNSETPVVEVL